MHSRRQKPGRLENGFLQGGLMEKDIIFSSRYPRLDGRLRPVADFGLVPKQNPGLCPSPPRGLTRSDSKSRRLVSVNRTTPVRRKGPWAQLSPYRCTLAFGPASQQACLFSPACVIATPLPFRDTGRKSLSICHGIAFPLKSSMVKFTAATVRRRHLHLVHESA